MSIKNSKFNDVIFSIQQETANFQFNKFKYLCLLKEILNIIKLYVNFY